LFIFLKIYIIIFITLEDDTILVVEYESKPNNKNMIKYGHYIFRIAESYYKEKLYKVILVVIYTGDVEAASNYLDIGSIQLNFQQVFLSKFDGQKMYEELKNKVENKLDLEDEDVLKFIILPLTQKKDKQKLIEDTINLAKEIGDENKQIFIIAGIISAVDKFIDKEYSKRMKEWIRMSKVARLFEEEKIDALNKLAQEKDEVIRKKDKEIKDLVNNIVKKNASHLISHRIKIEVFGSGVVHTDPKWLEFILQQLMDNSMKYGARTLIFEFTGHTLTVKDDGVGIPQSDLPRIFEYGFTGENGRKIAKSTGIGLYLCKKLCDKLGLEIIATSTEGTSIAITFPENPYVTFL